MLNRCDIDEDYPYDYGPDPIDCEDPDCDGSMFPAGVENYGADRDGRRGIKYQVYICNECGKEVWEG